MTDIADLLLRVRQGDPDAAVALADVVAGALEMPRRSVAAAFGVNRRGGVPAWRRERLARRDQAIRQLYSEADGITVEARLRAVRDMVQQACLKSSSNLNPIVFDIIESGERLPKRSGLRKIIEQES